MSSAEWPAPEWLEANGWAFVGSYADHVYGEVWDRGGVRLHLEAIRKGARVLNVHMVIPVDKIQELCKGLE